MSFYRHLVLPALDACFKRSVNDPIFRAHAMHHPHAEALAKRDAELAKALGYHIDDQWVARHTLSPALDRRDDWLLATGRVSKLTDALEVIGQWPDEPFMALGTHWGAGMPTLAHLASLGRHPIFVYRAEPDTVFDGVAARWSHRVHLSAMHRVGGTITLGGAYQQIMDAMSEAKTPVVLVDAPAEGRPTLVGRADGFSLHLRAGLLHMLCRENIHFAFYHCGFDPNTGQRQLKIGPSQVASEPQQIADMAAGHLKSALTLDSAQWRLWVAARSLLALPL